MGRMGAEGTLPPHLLDPPYELDTGSHGDLLGRTWESRARWPAGAPGGEGLPALSPGGAGLEGRSRRPLRGSGVTRNPGDRRPLLRPLPVFPHAPSARARPPAPEPSPSRQQLKRFQNGLFICSQ